MIYKPNYYTQDFDIPECSLNLNPLVTNVILDNSNRGCCQGCGKTLLSKEGYYTRLGNTYCNFGCYKGIKNGK